MMNETSHDLTSSMSGEKDESVASSLEEATTIAEAIQSILEAFDVQPVLFVGAGIARRYLGAPDWEGALRFALAQVQPPLHPYSYFVQKYGDNKIAIGTAIADIVFEWAWQNGKDRFPSALFEGSDRHIFIKALVAEQLVALHLMYFHY